MTITNKNLLLRRLIENVDIENRSEYFDKDMVKAGMCNKFIGRGSSRSSTEAYRKAAGTLANTGNYSADDWVFISAEGARVGRKDPDYDEIELAMKANATIVVDDDKNRKRKYNIGERQVEQCLKHGNYVCDSTGSVWTPGWKNNGNQDG
jgi:hypothetical protein